MHALFLYLTQLENIIQTENYIRKQKKMIMHKYAAIK